MVSEDLHIYHYQGHVAVPSSDTKWHLTREINYKILLS